MKIEIGAYAGFCTGVELCIKKLDKLLKENKNIYCLGEVVHNKCVVDSFKNKGLIVVDNIDEVKGNNLVIRAHGEPKETYELAKQRNINIHDLTCPKVLNIRTIVKDYINSDTFIILIAKKSHPEAIGTISFCGKNSNIVETDEELENIIPKLKEYKNILVIAQTTFNEMTFKAYTKIIEDNINNDQKLIIKNTICNATSLRQKEVLRLSKTKECMIIIGGINSSNTKKLYEISKQNCSNTFLIETKDDLNLNEIKKFTSIGIMAGASTPEYLINEVYEFIERGSNI